MTRLTLHRRSTDAAAAVDDIARVVLGGGIVALPWGTPHRATYAVLCRADDVDATRRLNELKGRPAHQVLAVVGTTCAARRVADLGPSGRLARLAPARGTDPAGLLDRTFAVGPVGVLLEAAAGAPAAVTAVGSDGRARVLVIGRTVAAEHETPFDALVRRLADDGVVLAGSSGNRHGAPTYTAHDHDAAATDLGPDVDLVVAPDQPLAHRRWWDAPVSCTAFDLTGDRAVVVRHGSLHPAVFTPALGRPRVARGVERIDGRQRWLAGFVERAVR